MLCKPMDYSLPGSCVLGILQASIQEWVAIPFPRGFSWPREWTQISHITGRFLQADSLLSEPAGKPWICIKQPYLNLYGYLLEEKLHWHLSDSVFILCQLSVHLISKEHNFLIPLKPLIQPTPIFCIRTYYLCVGSFFCLPQGYTLF